MVVQNQTNDPVNWTQSGSVPNLGGRLPPGGSEMFDPIGKAPYHVEFSDDHHHHAHSGPIHKREAIVTLEPNWTVTVTE